MADFPFAVNLKDLYINQSYISEFVMSGILKYAFLMSDLIFGAGIYF